MRCWARMLLCTGISPQWLYAWLACLVRPVQLVYHSVEQVLAVIGPGQVSCIGTDALRLHILGTVWHAAWHRLTPEG